MTTPTPRNALEEIDKMQADIEGVFAAHAVMYEGVKKIAEDILMPLKDRPDNDLTEHEKQLIAIARQLADLLSASADEIEKAAKRD